MEKAYDLVVIGSGPGGYVAAIRASQLGLKVACIEKENTLGGTCLNVGCIPSKALLESSSHFSYLTRHAKEFGILCDNPHVDFSQLMKKKQQAIDASTSGIEFLFKKNKITTIHGKAQLITPTTIKVGNDEISAKNILLATGSSPVLLPFLSIDEKTVVTSTGALKLETIPPKMVVIGGGVIGVELASVYSRLGSQVTVVEMLDQICTPLDRSTSRMFLQILQKQGITFLMKAKVTEAKKQGSQTALKVEHEDKTLELLADVVLIAVGRKPYTEGLGLENVSLPLTDKGFVSVDKNFRTAIPSIYAIGDVIEGPMLAHRASEEGMVVAELIHGSRSKMDYLCLPNVIYTHPEVASVGLSEDDARLAKIEIFQGICSFKANPRARCAGEMEGQVKVLGDKKTGQLLGVHIIGVNASEMIGEVVFAVKKRMSIVDLATLPHAHPTLSEAIKEACLNALEPVLGKAIHLT